MQAYYRIRDFCVAHNVTLVAVTKGRPIQDVWRLYHAGQRIFGENRVQHLHQRISEFTPEAQWHLIGHLQSNKVRQLPSQLKLIHSVDRPKLFPLLDEWARKRGDPLEVLIQIHIAQETTKYGFSYVAAEQLLCSPELKQYTFCKVVGLMGMATFTDDVAQIRSEFRGLRRFFDKLRGQLPHLQILSMGMSNDYQIAVEEGSTMVRIGSALFADQA
ncbi:MAG: YggS family pyridoxal phosphate-dependent enzyme [Chitinophagales bacterium]|nr:YggS family pyridoxal phosphate-dependent enzyme [Chitinophagales bacterium]MDW8428769.1 YggS family pyridoxal phosphate-dependent enzyme [Chitinophagales bacterium]